MPQDRAVRDVLPGHPLARHIDDFLADLANANKPRNTIRAYRGDLTGFAAHHDGDIATLTAAPVRAFLGEIAGQAPATRKRKRAAVASFCK
jgi:integrase/recombinase XerC/integrase/recombinase XerD